MRTAMERAWDWGSKFNLAHVSRFAAQRLTHGVRCDAPDLLSGSADTGPVIVNSSTTRPVEVLLAQDFVSNCPEKRYFVSESKRSAV